MPYYKYIEMWTVTDATTRALGVEAGDYQFAANPSQTAVAAAKDSDKMKGWYLPSAGRIANMVFNSDSEPLNIMECRQAVALAINYEAQLAVAASGEGMLSDCALYSPINEYYTPASNPDKNFIKYDPDLAKEKLVEAGYPNGFTIDCKYRTTEAMTISSAEMLQNQLAAVGITLELVPMEAAAWYADMRAGNWDTHLSVGGNPNPKRSIMTCDGNRIDHNAATGSCGKNWAPEGMEDLIDRCLMTVDDAARMAAFTEFNDVCREYIPMVLLYCPYTAYLTSPEIVNIGTNSYGGPNFCTTYPAEYLEG